MNIENIKKVNKDIVKDGRVQSFKEQLFDVFTGGYDLNNMMVVSDNSKTLNYVDGIDENKIITISPNKVLKVMTEHKLSLQELGEIENLLKNSVIAFDSLTHESSRVVVLDKQDIDGNILIAIFKTDTTVNVLDVNQITSIYGKKNFENFINRTYEAGKNIYVNDKTKEFVDTQGLQLPNCITNSLYSNDIGVINISQALNNNQIEELLIEGAKKAIINHLNDRGEDKKFLYEKFNEDNPDIKHIQMGEYKTTDGKHIIKDEFNLEKQTWTNFVDNVEINVINFDYDNQGNISGLKNTIDFFNQFGEWENENLSDIFDEIIHINKENLRERLGLGYELLTINAEERIVLFDLDERAYETEKYGTMIINYINNCQEPYILAEEIEENIDNGLVSKKDKFKFKEFVNEYIFKTGKMYTGMELEVNDDLKEWTENYFGALIQEHKAEAKMNNQIKQSDNAVEKKQDKSIFIETKEDIECEF